jgi:hypothetical protein
MSTTQRYVYVVLGLGTTAGVPDGVYATDGTAAGTTLITAANTPLTPSYQMATLPNGEVVFTEHYYNPSDPLSMIQALQLWETNGTAAGTATFMSFPDVGTGLPNDGAGMSNFVSFGTRVLFEYAPGDGSYALYSTDGTQAGTVPLSMYSIDSGSIGAGDGASTGSKYIYTAMGTTLQAGVSGVYATDGTTLQGATLLKAASTAFTPGYQMATLPNGEVVFTEHYYNPSDPLSTVQALQLWETNGTAAGTAMFMSLPDASTGLPNDGAGLSNLVSFGTRVLFEYAPGDGSYALYSTDGTQAGTVPLSMYSIDPGSIGAGDGASTGSKYIYTTLGTTPLAGVSGVYATDGTTLQGATLLKAASTAFQPGYQMAALPNGEVLFSVRYYNPLDIGGSITQGVQLWETNGTAGGTAMVTGFVDATPGTNDKSQLVNFVSAGSTVMFEYTDGLGDYTLYSTDGTAAGTVQVASSVNASTAGLGLGADTAACFAAGTHIATPNGDVAVEDLAAGDLVLTLSGAAVPVVWTGHRSVDCRAHSVPQAVWPVRVRAGAFADGVPHRDVWLSPDHAVFVDGVLVPVKHLIDGAGIAQVPAAQVRYHHVELRQHDVLLAEGLPAESYLDTGDRWRFHHCEDTIRLLPDHATPTRHASAVWEMLGCAPLVVSGPDLAAIRQRLHARAAADARTQPIQRPAAA